jgi:hypothetical protein
MNQLQDENGNYILLDNHIAKIRTEGWSVESFRILEDVLDLLSKRSHQVTLEDANMRDRVLKQVNVIREHGTITIKQN